MINLWSLLISVRSILLNLLLSTILYMSCSVFLKYILNHNFIIFIIIIILHNTVQ